METIFVRQTDGVISDNSINVIPIKIITDVVLPVTNTSKYSDRVVDDTTKKFIYSDINNNITSDIFTVTPTPNFIESGIISCSVGDMTGIPDKINFGNTHNNTPIIDTVKLYEFERVTGTNAHRFKIDDILDTEFQNILDSSEYNNAVYDFFNDSLDIRNASFVTLNKFKLVLSPNDNVTFNLKGVNIKEHLTLFNIPDGMGIRLNTINIDTNQNNTGGIDYNISTADLSIEFSNTSSKTLVCINPYILSV